MMASRSTTTMTAEAAVAISRSTEVIEIKAGIELRRMSIGENNGSCVSVPD